MAAGAGRPAWAGQLALLLTVGVAAYLGTCLAVGDAKGARWLVERLPIYPRGAGRPAWAGQLALLLTVGVAAYLGTCLAVGEHTAADLLPRRFRK